MCQLLGMNTNTPTDIGFSFTGFRERGGNTDHHSDGFGIAFFEPSNFELSGESPAQHRGKGLRLFHDDKASFNSPVAELVKNYPIKALNVVAHIRKATQGHNCLANTHPFVREIWGEQWVFAHNGQMTENFISHCQRLQQEGNSTHCEPVGTTDSEMAFCYLLNRLKSTFKSRPSDTVLFEFLTTQCRDLATHGLFNCLLSNGDWQLAYASTLLFYLTRKTPFGEAKLADDDLAINFSDVTTDSDKVTIIVTIPLTDNETWQQMAVNECLIFRDGDIIYQNIPNNKTYLSIEDGIAIAREVGAST